MALRVSVAALHSLVRYVPSSRSVCKSQSLKILWLAPPHNHKADVADSDPPPVTRLDPRPSRERATGRRGGSGTAQSLSAHSERFCGFFARGAQYIIVQGAQRRFV